MDDLEKKHLILLQSLKLDSYDNFVEKLFKYEEHLNLNNKEGETLLHYACYFGFLDKYYALINFGCEIKKTFKNNTLLHYASFSGKDPFMIVELIKSGINPLDLNNKNETCFHLSSDGKICNYLNIWAYRNNVNLTTLLDFEKNNILHSSSKYGHNEAFLYWGKEYPELAELTNIENLLPHQVKHLNSDFCQ